MSDDDKNPAPTARVIHADCLSALRDMTDASVDAVVTDPPYGLSNTTPAQVAETITQWVIGDREYLPSARGFMGHEWDGFVPPVAVWDECLRVLKPGGHLLAFAGSRTHDLMTLGIRLAGFEIRDSVAWLYGSGFPKSLDVSKAIDKAAGAEREVVGSKLDRPGYHLNGHESSGAAYGAGFRSSTTESRLRTAQVTAPATDAAREWEGWGTALKPAFEPVTLARKPLAGTVAATVLEHGTGALNIDGCRIATSDQWRADDAPSVAANGYGPTDSDGWSGAWNKRSGSHRSGRWPANVVLDESQAEALDRQSGVSKSPVGNAAYTRSTTGDKYNDPYLRGSRVEFNNYGDSGGASRFFYVAKAPKSERPVVGGVAHPTVKPLALMRWLVRMVTPPGGVVVDPFAGSGTTVEAALAEGFDVVDPFAGSGTTVEAALAEGFDVVGIEREADYLPLIQARIDRATASD